MHKRIGGGTIETITISVDGRLQQVPARVGLFGTGICVIHDGPRNLGVPYWENQLVHELREGGEEDLAVLYTPDNLVYQRIQSVFSGVRQALRILDGNYGVSFAAGMKGRLVGAVATLRMINSAATGLWTTTIETQIEGFHKLVERLIGQIGTRPTDYRKREVLKIAEAISDGKDSTGRVNQTVVMAKSVAGMNRVESVIDGILSIEPVIVARQRAFINMLHLAEGVTIGAREFLEKLFAMENAAISSAKPQIDSALGFYIQEFTEMDFSPYFRTFYMCAREFGDAQKHLREDRVDEALAVLRQSLESLKIRVVRTDVERLLLVIELHRINPREHKVDIRHIHSTLGDAVKTLSAVNESGFALPVTEEAVRSLSYARELIATANSVSSLNAEFDHTVREGIKLL